MAVIYGLKGFETKNGTSGNDTIYGWAIGDNANSPSGNDTLFGNAGNDILYGGTSNDSLDGSTGLDTLYGGSDNDTVRGGDGNDRLYGEAGNDSLDGGKSNDYLYGGTGNDILSGGDGNDYLEGDDGNDKLYGQAGTDTLYGEAGSDTLDGGIGSDRLFGGTGNDIYIYDATDTIVEYLNAGIDTVNSSIQYTLGSHLENLILTGSSSISGTGNSLNNTITGNAATRNSLSGGGGNDTLYGGKGEPSSEEENGTNTFPLLDSLSGGLGNDTSIIDSVYYSFEYLVDGFPPRVYTDTDYIFENSNEGVDTVNLAINAPSYSEPEYHLKSEVENLTLVGSSNISGGGNTLNNTVTGNPGNNKLYGDEGDDLIQGGAGNDYLIDLYYSNLRGAVSYRQGGNDTMFGGTGNDTLYGFDNNDYLSGDDGNDTLVGDTGDSFYDQPNDLFPGSDTLIGGKGNDELYGNGSTYLFNDGSDILTGGAGADKFGFYSPDEGIDAIKDFVVADDTISVSAFNFGSGLTAGAAITAAQFRIGSAAGDDSDRFVYNKITGGLFFDSDGTGSVGQAQFATLSSNLTLTYLDIVVF